MTLITIERESVSGPYNEESYKVIARRRLIKPSEDRVAWVVPACPLPGREDAIEGDENARACDQSPSNRFNLRLGAFRKPRGIVLESQCPRWKAVRRTSVDSRAPGNRTFPTAQLHHEEPGSNDRFDLFTTLLSV